MGKDKKIKHELVEITGDRAAYIADKMVELFQKENVTPIEAMYVMQGLIRKMESDGFKIREVRISGKN